jgi:hypothetical protein
MKFAAAGQIIACHTKDRPKAISVARRGCDQATRNALLR